MSKEKINETLPKEQRLGQIGINNQGLKMTIIKYKNSKDINVQFEDGTIVENRTYDSFKKGNIANLNYKHSLNLINDRIGEVSINNQGLKMIIIDYRSANDIDIQFERDKFIIRKKTYMEFKMGYIRHPNEYSDGVSISEKFMINVLRQLNIKFTTQLNKSIFTWCQNYKYDFYIPSLNMIIETHGVQHYQTSFKNLGAKTLKEEQKNDEYKKELALKNNINNYIIVDCRKSEFDWLKENVIKELSFYFDLSNIDWDVVWENSLKSLIWEVKRLYEEGYMDKEIAEILKINKKTVGRYKKQLGIKTKNELKQENLLKTKELLEKGYTIKQITKELNVDRATVYNYKKQLNL